MRRLAEIHYLIGFSLVLIILILLRPHSCQAQLGENLFSISAKAISLGNAVTADYVGLDSIHFNPAALSQLPKNRKVTDIKGVMLPYGKRTSRLSDDRLGHYTNLNLIYESSDGEICQNQCLLKDEDQTDFKQIDIAPNKEKTSEIFVPIPFPIYLPNIGYNPPNSDFSFGFATFVPLAIAWNFATNDPFRYPVPSVALVRFTFAAPAFSYDITDRFSVGMALKFTKTFVKAELDYRLPNLVLGGVNKALNDLCEDQNSAQNSECFGVVDPLSPLSSLLHAETNTIRSDRVSLGLNFGIQARLTNWLTWGLSWRSTESERLKGSAYVELNNGLESLLVNLDRLSGGLSGDLFIEGIPETVDVAIDIEMPQHIATGISIQLTHALKINLDYRWTEYSKWADWPVEVSGNSSMSELLERFNLSRVSVPIGTKDQSNYCIGFQFNDKYQRIWRWGYEFRPSTNSDKGLIPLGDMSIYSLGGSFPYKTKKLNTNVDFSLSYIYSDLNRASNEYPLNSTSQTQIFAVLPGLDIQHSINVLLVQVGWQTEF